MVVPLRQQTRRPGPGGVATPASMSGTKWECNLQRKFNQDITRIIKQTSNTPNFNKANFSLIIAAGVASTFGIFGNVAAHAKEGRSHSLSGVASVYSTESGHGTASGQRLNPGALTAAHR